MIKIILFLCALFFTQTILAQTKKSPIYKKNGIEINFKDSILITENKNKNVNSFLSSYSEIVSFNPVKRSSQSSFENGFSQPQQIIRSDIHLNKTKETDISPFNNHDLNQFLSRMYVFENSMSKKQFKRFVERQSKQKNQHQLGQYQLSEITVNGQKFLRIYKQNGKSRICHYILQKKKKVYWFRSSPYGEEDTIKEVILTMRFL